MPGNDILTLNVLTHISTVIKKSDTATCIVLILIVNLGSQLLIPPNTILHSTFISLFNVHESVHRE